jgi:hypothetical protein
MYEVRNKNLPTALPFVGRTKHKQSLSFWTTPCNGDYLQGTRDGADMAKAYAEYVAQGNDMPPILAQVALDMLTTEQLPEALQGQVVGFFSVLERLLAQKTTKNGS